ncbi:MAG TPA: FMN-binding protein [Sedimentisphaerales bacterium]|nr:FMN-binding protein [Sedimentisphaerales bacterium]
MIRKQPWYPIVYMFCVTAFFSTVVIGFTRLTSERVEANQRLALEGAVLAVLPGVQDETLSNPELHRRFTESVGLPDESSGGAYTLKEDGRVAAYAVPIEGRGFWAPIKGMIGVKADKKTITGIAFYEQSETPGLGAEIAKSSFRDQFRNKEISSQDKPLIMRRPGETLGRSEVHAVTGATQTSTRLEGIINAGLKQWQTQMAGKSEGGER